MEKKRCFWVNMKNPAYVQYHDEEWGCPCHDDQQLYELLLLECFQAGLSWECVLNKRESFRKAFDGFDINKVIAYAKNSIVFTQIQDEYGSFDRYIWGFTNGKIIDEDCNRRTSSPLSDLISKDLKKRGMTFVGTVVIYSYLQAIGILNAHTKDCFCFHHTGAMSGEK